MNILTRIILKVKWIFSFLNTRGTHRTFNFQFGYVVVTESPRQRQSMKQEDSAVYLDVPAPAKAESTFRGAPLELIQLACHSRFGCFYTPLCPWGSCGQPTPMRFSLLGGIPWSEKESSSRSFPGEIKGPNTNCRKRLVCVERQELCQDCYEHISKLEIQGSMGSSCVRETENQFHFQCDPSQDCMHSILTVYMFLLYLQRGLWQGMVRIREGMVQCKLRQVRERQGQCGQLTGRILRRKGASYNTPIYLMVLYSNVCYSIWQKK